MGTFRSLFVRFPCERCETDSENEISWQQVRKNASEVLTAFGWAVDDPPLPLDDTQWQQWGENPNHGEDTRSNDGSISSAGYYSRIQAHMNRA